MLSNAKLRVEPKTSRKVYMSVNDHNFRVALPSYLFVFILYPKHTLCLNSRPERI